MSRSVCWLLAAACALSACGSPDRELIERRVSGVRAARSGDLLVSCGEEGEVSVRRGGLDAPVIYRERGLPLYACAVSGPHYAAWAGLDGKITLFSAAAGKPAARFMAGEWSVLDLRFSPDGRCLASAGMDGAVKIWSVPSGRLYRELKRNNFPVRSVSFSPDGRYLVGAGYDSMAVLWDLKDGRAVKAISAGMEGALETVAFSPSGLLAYGGQGRTIKVWEPLTGRLVCSLEGRFGANVSLAFSPDSGKLLSGDMSGNLTVWDLDGCSVSRKLAAGPGPVNSVSFLPGGNSVLAASGGEVRVIQLR